MIGPQFRRMKILKSMKQTNQALLRLKNVSMIQTLDDFSAYMPSEIEEQKIHLPTKQVLEYILVRLQGVSKLLCRVIKCAKEAGKHSLQMVSIGNFFAKNAIFLGILGEIMCVSKERLDTIIELYNDLVEFKDKLKSSGNEWLSSTYELPNDLKIWLGSNYPIVQSEPIKEIIAVKSKSQSSLFNVLPNIADSDEELTEDTKTFALFKQNEEDADGTDFIRFSEEIPKGDILGEKIERKETIQEKLNTIKTSNDVDFFIKSEDTARLQRNHSAFTSAVSKKDWHEFKCKIKSSLKTSTNKSVVKKFKMELNKLLV